MITESTATHWYSGWVSVWHYSTCYLIVSCCVDPPPVAPGRVARNLPCPARPWTSAPWRSTCWATGCAWWSSATKRPRSQTLLADCQSYSTVINSTTLDDSVVSLVLKCNERHPLVSGVKKERAELPECIEVAWYGPARWDLRCGSTWSCLVSKRRCHSESSCCYWPSWPCRWEWRRRREVCGHHTCGSPLHWPRLRTQHKLLITSL